MNKFLLIILLLLPLVSFAGGKPCSGKKGGISQCEGSQFVCNDGSISKSAKNCSSYVNDKSQLKAISVESTPATLANPELTKISSSILKLDYSGFTVWVDCSKRGPIKFQYVAQRDTGHFKRFDKFSLDPKVPKNCQQFNTKAYGMNYETASSHLEPMFRPLVGSKRGDEDESGQPKALAVA